MNERPAQRRAIFTLVFLNIAVLATLVGLVVSGRGGPQWRDSVLAVERLEIVDGSGRPLLVLANGPRLPGPMFHGKEYPQAFADRGRTAGMIFYNSAGDEIGGLIFDGAARDSGYSALGHLSFDQWQQSQVVALTYADNGSDRLAGLRVWDRPEVPLEDQFQAAERFVAAEEDERDSLREAMNEARERVAGTQRVFVGSENRTASVELSDPEGNVRARLAVDDRGHARLQFIDEDGQVTAEYPGS